MDGGRDPAGRGGRGRHRTTAAAWRGRGRPSRVPRPGTGPAAAVLLTPGVPLVKVVRSFRSPRGGREEGEGAQGRRQHGRAQCKPSGPQWSGGAVMGPVYTGCPAHPPGNVRLRLRFATYERAGGAVWAWLGEGGGGPGGGGGEGVAGRGHPGSSHYPLDLVTARMEGCRAPGGEGGEGSVLEWQGPRQGGSTAPKGGQRGGSSGGLGPLPAQGVPCERGPSSSPYEMCHQVADPVS